MAMGERWVLKERFEGVPKNEYFQLVKEEVEPLKENEILFETEFVSVDPYLRYRVRQMDTPCTMFGSVVARITETKAEGFPVGGRIVAYCGWVKKGKLNVKESRAQGLPTATLVPEAAGAGISSSHLLGALGMPGATAYLGLMELCQPKKGETLVVNAAAGAVGSLVGQIGKIVGCRVIGYAGTDEKVEWLKKELGFDAAYNYKTVNFAESLKEAAPKGVDCFFENVGGEESITIMNHMNKFGRVAICGIISTYNDEGQAEKISPLHPVILRKELRIEGFIVSRWAGAKNMEAMMQLGAWIKEGKLKVKETIIDGFEKTPEAFAGLFTGANMGKMVVKA